MEKFLGSSSKVFEFFLIDILIFKYFISFYYKINLNEFMKVNFFF